jgi:hypothetical protein
VIWFWTALFLDSAHMFASVPLAWTNAGFRRHMLANWRKFVAMPVPSSPPR